MQLTQQYHRTFSGTSVPVRSGVSTSNRGERYSGIQSVGHESTWVPFLRPIALSLSAFFCLIVLMATFNPTDLRMSAQQATATILEGDAELIRNRDGLIEELTETAQGNLALYDMLSTSSGTVQIQFSEHHRAELAPSSQLTLEQFDADETGLRLAYTLWGGTVVHRVEGESGPNDWVQIATPSSSAWIRNAVISVHVLNANQTYYRVDEGVARLTQGKEEIFLAPRETMILSQEGRLTDDLPPQLTLSDQPSSSLGDGPTTITTLTTSPSEPTDSRYLTNTVSDRSSNVNHSTENQSAGDAADNAWKTYVVVPGDSMWSIAAQQGLSIEVLAQANPTILDFGLIQVGQTISIPLN